MARRLLTPRLGAASAVQLGSRALLLLDSSSLSLLAAKRHSHELTEAERAAYIAISVALVLLAGLMSGLTLGLLSLDALDVEVLTRSGTPAEKRYAGAIKPLVERQHFVLVTLLLCNAGAMEALPLFLDRLADPVTAIAISVSAVLVFGEILPQAVCSRYGLAIGYYCAWLVRALMALTFPVSYPISCLLDAMLGAGRPALLRRTQLKALVDLHGADEGLGGNLTEDEVQVICGALDLTAKTARRSMTPLDKVFMLPSDAVLDRSTLRTVLGSGHSRVPVHAAGERAAILGLIMVKELLAYRGRGDVRVADVRMRSLPRLPADTAMYDLLKLFQTGRSHMVVLTEPPADAPLAHADAAATAAPPPATPFANGGKGADAAAEDDGNGEAAAPTGIGGGMSADAALAAREAREAALSGVPVGVITIEDVIEELMGAEIVDETDCFVDNERSVTVNPRLLAQGLPAQLRRVLERGGDIGGWGGGGGFGGGGGGGGALYVQVPGVAAAAAASGATTPVGPGVAVGKADLRFLAAAVGGATARPLRVGTPPDSLARTSPVIDALREPLIRREGAPR